jgi:hypothetical protein
LSQSGSKSVLIGVNFLDSLFSLPAAIAVSDRSQFPLILELRYDSRNSAYALRADAAQSALCAYLSLIALAGLAVNAIWRVKWADLIAALAILPLIVWEGREAMRGKACVCC